MGISWNRKSIIELLPKLCRRSAGKGGYLDVFCGVEAADEVLFVVFPVSFLQLIQNTTNKTQLIEKIDLIVGIIKFLTTYKQRER